MNIYEPVSKTRFCPSGHAYHGSPGTKCPKCYPKRENSRVSVTNWERSGRLRRLSQKLSDALDLIEDCSDSMPRAFTKIRSQVKEAYESVEILIDDAVDTNPVNDDPDIADDDVKLDHIPDTKECRQLLAQFDQEKFWPNVWHVNERGNTDLLKITARGAKIVKSWV